MNALDLAVHNRVDSHLMGPIRTSAKPWARNSCTGIKSADANGVARFTTIYPGWYPGRTVHIHFMVRSAASATSAYEFTSQLFFDDNFTDRVYA